ncbi:AraC family transcriptional regulator [Flavobacterium sp. ST-75]|uniref:AraC family transcriptional regulator n=1 Tax=Flavobacterium rhizophilum TaxID=3163296 RepID=A0ABW8Y958_9FLAO
METTRENSPGEVHFWKGSHHFPSRERRTCSGDFLFIFIKSGILRAVVDGSRISCTANELVVALCRSYYQVIKYDKDISGYLVKVNWQFITDIKMSGRFIELLVSRHALKILPDRLDAVVLHRIMKLLNHYYQYLRNPNRFPKASFTAALSLLVFQAAWHQDIQAGKSESNYSRRELLTVAFFRQLIRHYREQHSVAFYAGQLCVTTGYLSRVVREVTGKTVLESITEILVSDSKFLLVGSDATIEEISEQLHFTSAGSFSRLFKKQTGMTPTRYRKSYGR